MLPRSVFLDVVDRVRQRSAGGAVANDAGLLVSLLRLAVRECTAAERAAELEHTVAYPTHSRTDTLRRDPELYVDELGWTFVADGERELLVEALFQIVPDDEARRAELLERADRKAAITERKAAAA